MNSPRNDVRIPSPLDPENTQHIELTRDEVRVGLQLRTAFTVPAPEDQRRLTKRLDVYVSPSGSPFILIPAKILGPSSRGWKATFFDVTRNVLLESNDAEIWASLTTGAAPTTIDSALELFRAFLEANAEGRRRKPLPEPRPVFTGVTAFVVDEAPRLLGPREASNVTAKTVSRGSADVLSPLSEEQKRVMALVHVKHRQLLLVTGAAGTGKSVLVKAIARLGNTLVAAPSGIAALSVNGSTIHRSFGFPIGVLQASALEPLRYDTRKILQQVKRIVLDEVSMIRADLLDAIDARLRDARETAEPFGGVQVIMVGDPFQLPPVATREDEPLLRHLGYRTPFFFSSNVVKRHPPVHTTLTIQHRQTDDAVFLGILNRLRLGHHSDPDLAQLNQRVRMQDEVSETAVYLCARNAAADALNGKKMAQLTARRRTFVAEAKWSQGEKPAEEALVLCEGARVVLLRNDPDGSWVNGSRGTVTGFREDSVEVALDGGRVGNISRAKWELREPYIDPNTDEVSYRVIGTFVQFPLRLCWALSIHKSQGMTLGNIAIDLGQGGFASGQTYVALSRCRKLVDIELLAPLTDKDVLVEPLVLQFLDWLASKDENVRRDLA